MEQTAQNIEGSIAIEGKSDASSATITLVGNSNGTNSVSKTFVTQNNGEFILTNLPLDEYKYTINYDNNLYETVEGIVTLDGSLELFTLEDITIRNSYVKIN